jgi:1-deoxy-D-xylulose-5-phosphate synthase
MDVLRTPRPAGAGALLGAGPMWRLRRAADRLADAASASRSIDPLGQAARHRAAVAARQHGRDRHGRGDDASAFGDAVARLLRDSDIDTPVRTFGLEQSFLEHGERAQVLETQGLTPQHLARRITEIVAQRAPELADEGQRA